MFKRENIRKNFLRVKQSADQKLGRSEKSEVLSNDLHTSEKRVDIVKHVCSNTVKKLGASLLGSTTSDGEKKLKKMPEAALGHSMIESANILGTDGIMGQLFQMTGECQSCLAQKHLQYEIDAEKNVVEPLQEILEVQIPQIFRLKKALNKVTLDMDSAKNRWNTAVKQTQVPGINMASASAKADTVKDEFEEASNRVDQARDALTTGLFSFISREAEHSENLLSLLEAQATHHREALEVIEKVIPRMRESLSCNPTKPVYGVSLEEHLRVTNRDIAQVLEDSICFLIETGLDEEGLFRIAGMASKLKKLKASFDAGVDFDDNGELDQHTVAGAMKQYLRELPEPLLTFDLFPDFMAAVQKYETIGYSKRTKQLYHRQYNFGRPADQRLQAIWCVVDKLPKPNYDNFRYLIKFLSKLAERSDVNKMTPSNIAIVIGPNLMWSEGDSGPNMANTGILSLITEMIVQNADWFFPGANVDVANDESAISAHSLRKNNQKDVDYHATQRGEAPEHTQQGAPPDLKPSTPKPLIPIEITSPATAPIAGSYKPIPARRSLTGKGDSPPALPVPPRRSKSIASTTSSEATTLSNQSLSAYENAETLERQDTGAGHNRITDDKPKSGTFPTAVTTNINTATKAPNPVITFSPKDRDKYRSNGVSSSPRTMPITSPPTSNVHSDMYDTAFALQSLGNGAPGYLSKVRTIWDDQLQRTPTAEGSVTEKITPGSSTGLPTVTTRTKVLDINFGCGSDSPISYRTPESQSLERAGSNHSVSSQGTPQTSPSPVPNHDTASTIAPPQTPPTMSRSPSVSPGSSQVNLSQAPLAESEELTPIKRRQTRKPAPAPPERPYTVAVSASIKSNPIQQHKTWPRYATPPQMDSTGNTLSQSDKQRTLPPERPHPPERISSLGGHHGHAERPKVPPPVVPLGHQRSASAGGSVPPAQLLQSMSYPAGTAGDVGSQSLGAPDGESGSTSDMNKTGTL